MQPCHHPNLHSITKKKRRGYKKTKNGRKYMTKGSRVLKTINRKKQR